ncbi:MAG: sigma-70 family RNA polymerase sigma factor [Armatimonadetes bacterium]|nr:sigma-70 family RNA polymerase sigma factor [Armatimonadota bacterium]
MSTPQDAIDRVAAAYHADLLRDDDAVLIARSKQGDREAFDRLIERYSTQIYNFAYRMSGNREDAEDIYQDAFIHAFNGIKNFRSDAAFSTWLYRIVRNVYLDEQKRRRSRQFISLEESIETDDGSIARDVQDDGPTPDEIAEQNQRRRAVRQAIALLPDRQREIIILYELQQCTYEEIADVLQINVGTVKSRLNRARRSLRDRLLAFKELFDL